MSGPVVQQMLLTRFNIRYSGVGWTPDQAPDWLEGRFDLFARYCAPSVAAQTLAEFDWVIFCDVATAAADLDRIQAFDPRIRVVLFAPDAETNGTGASPAGVADYPVVRRLEIQPLVRPETEVVLSTRLDSDDALSRHALARARDHLDRFLATGHRRWLYNPLCGFQWDERSRRLFSIEKPNSAFLTMFERAGRGERPRGPYAGNHSHMYRQYPSYQDDGAWLWLMILHGGNVINRLGPDSLEVPIAALGDDFAVDLLGAPGEPS
jgi:hypothetical protein